MWKIKNQPSDSTSYYNHYDFNVEGTKANKDFGSFLKSFGI